MASGPIGLRFRLVAFVAAAFAFAAGAMLPAQSTDPAERETFEAPVVNGLPLDACRTSGGGCGQPTADAFCRAEGYEKAGVWSVALAARTWSAGSGLICKTDAGTRCTSLRNVTCVRPAAPAGSRTYAVPMANDAPIDRCRLSGNDCGKAAADQFCRTQDFAQATSWAAATYRQTWNIVSGEFCNASAARPCEGLRNVVCSGGAASRFKVPSGTYALPTLSSPINTAAPGRLEAAPGLGAPPLGIAATAWIGGSLEQMRQNLTAERYARLFADVAMAIAPYSRIARLQDGVELPASIGRSAAAAADWNAYLRFGLADGPASAKAVAVQLSQLDRLLLTGDRVALSQELVAIFSKHQP